MLKRALFIGLFLFSGLLGFAQEMKVGDVAPSLMGPKAMGSGMLKLSQLNRDLSFERGPDGKLIEEDGKYKMSISKNVVVLNFFARTCIPCIREIPTFNKIAQDFKDKNVRFAYINVDPDLDAEGMKRFIIKRKIKVPVMLPNQRDAVRKFDVVSLPRLIVIDKNGKVAHIIRGFDENLSANLSAMINSLL